MLIHDKWSPDERYIYQQVVSPELVHAKAQSEAALVGLGFWGVGQTLVRHGAKVADASRTGDE